jgi:hypothetical protein
MSLKKYSRRWVDTNIYKTFEILLYFTQRASNAPVVPDNKAKTRYKTICPLHTEKTASFKLHNNLPNKVWMYKCLGCGRSGDVFKLLMEKEGLEFWDALVMVKKAFPNYYSKYKTPTSKRQLKLGFPVNEKGEFIWVSKDMRQIGFQ